MISEADSEELKFDSVDHLGTGKTCRDALRSQGNGILSDMGCNGRTRRINSNRKKDAARTSPPESKMAAPPGLVVASPQPLASPQPREPGGWNSPGHKCLDREWAEAIMATCSVVQKVQTGQVVSPARATHPGLGQPKVLDLQRQILEARAKEEVAKYRKRMCLEQEPLKVPLPSQVPVPHQFVFGSELKRSCALESLELFERSTPSNFDLTAPLKIDLKLLAS